MRPYRLKYFSLVKPLFKPVLGVNTLKWIKSGLPETVILYFDTDLLLLACPTWRLALSCPERLIISLSVPMPWVQRVADRVHLRLAFLPVWDSNPQDAEREVWRLTDWATREGFIHDLCTFICYRDLNKCRSQTCATFDNEPLAEEGEDFTLKTLECWSFDMM